MTVNVNCWQCWTRIDPSVFEKVVGLCHLPRTAIFNSEVRLTLVIRKETREPGPFGLNPRLRLHTWIKSINISRCVTRHGGVVLNRIGPDWAYAVPWPSAVSRLGRAEVSPERQSGSVPRAVTFHLNSKFE